MARKAQHSIPSKKRGDIKNNDLHKMIDNIVHERLNKIAGTIAVSSRNKKIEYAEKGLNRSGQIVTAIIKIIKTNIMNGCEDTINEIIAIQQKLNLKFKKKDYEHAVQVTTSRFISFTEQSFNTESSGSALKLPMIEDCLMTVDMHERILLQNLKGMVKKAFDNDKQMLKLKKTKPALKAANRANIISAIAGLIALVALLHSLLT